MDLSASRIDGLDSFRSILLGCRGHIQKDNAQIKQSALIVRVSMAKETIAKRLVDQKQSSAILGKTLTFTNLILQASLCHKNAFSTEGSYC